MFIHTINHTDTQIAQQVFELMQLAYGEEAQLINAEDFPPLRRTAEDIRKCHSQFLACKEGNEIHAVIELENDAAKVNIVSLVVHPGQARKGLGKALVNAACALAAVKKVFVQTAAGNFPALNLYESLGFQRINEFETQDGYSLVELSR